MSQIERDIIAFAKNGNDDRVVALRGKDWDKLVGFLSKTLSEENFKELVALNLTQQTFELETHED